MILKDPFKWIAAIVIALSMIPFIHSGSDELLHVEGVEEQDSRFSGGNGSPADPYEIASVNALQNMNDHLDSHFILIDDIDASETIDWNDGKGFIPIAPDVDKYTHSHNGPKFNGSFDGNGYSIDSLWINDTNYEYYFGLFSFVGEAALIRNVEIIDIYLGHGSIAGAIAGENHGIIKDSQVSGIIDGRGNPVGGIVGKNNAIIQNCIFIGNVSGWTDIGGIAGENDGEIIRSSALANVTSRHYYCGGFVGRNFGRIADSYSYGEVKGEHEEQALIGANEGEVINSYYCINYTSLNNEIPSSPYGIYEEHFIDWLNNGLHLNIDDYLDKYLGDQDFYQIRSQFDLYNMIPFANDDKKFIQTRDIELTGITNFNIPMFNAEEYDGNGYIISNLTLNCPDQDVLGFFGEIGHGSTVKDLHLADADIIGSDYIGGIAAKNYGSIISCTADIFPSGKNYVGGLVGQVWDGTVKDCNASGYIVGTDSIGGLIGGNYNGSVIDSSSSCRVEGDGNNIGGLIGYSEPFNYWENIKREKTILGCSSSGDVIGIDNVGGLVGWNCDNIEYCQTSGDVSGETSIGGLVGRSLYCNIKYSSSKGEISSSNYFGGGLAGWLENCHTTNCYTASEVNGLNTCGGFVGYNLKGDIDSCVSTGNVNGFATTGGFTGRNLYGWINNSYCFGDVIGEEISGGFIGLADRGGVYHSYCIGSVTGSYRSGSFIGYSNHEPYHPVINSYFNSATSGQTTSAGGEGKTTYELKSNSTYVAGGWDLNDIWSIEDHRTYPFLRDLDYSSMITGQYEKIGYSTYKYQAEFDYTVSIEGLPTGFTFELETDAGPWLSITNSGDLSGIPQQGDEGTYNISIILKANEIEFCRYQFDLEILDINDTLEITNDFSPLAIEDELFNVQCTYIDRGPEPRPLQWRLDTDADFLSLSQTPPALSGDPSNEDVGSYWVNISLSDATGRNCWDNITLEVQNVNDPPEITTTSLPNGEVDIVYSINMTSIDIDPTNDTLIWSMTTNSSFLVLDKNTGRLVGIPKENDIGQYWLIITVDDGNNGIVAVNFTIFVNERTYLPGITGLNHSIEIDEDNEVDIYLKDYFLNLEYIGSNFQLDPFNFNFSIDDYNLTLIPKENWNGNETVEIIGIFGEETLSIFLNITVAPVNDRPYDIEIKSVTICNEGDLITLDCIYKNPDIFEGDNLSFLWESHISGLIGEDAMIEVHLCAGIHQATLTITDSGGLSNSTTTSIEVLPVNDDGGDENNDPNGMIMIVIISCAILLFIAVLFSVIFIVLKKKDPERKDHEEKIADDLSEDSIDELFGPGPEETFEEPVMENLELSDISQGNDPFGENVQLPDMKRENGSVDVSEPTDIGINEELSDETLLEPT